MVICMCSFSGSEHIVHCLINLGEVREFAIVVDVDFLIMTFGLLFTWFLLWFFSSTMSNATHPIVLGQHKCWVHSVKGDLAEDAEGWLALDKQNPTRHLCDSSRFLWHPMPPDFTLGIIQFREPLSQPRVIKAVRNIFPRAVLMADMLKEEDLDRHIKATKDLKHWNDDRFE